MLLTRCLEWRDGHAVPRVSAVPVSAAKVPCKSDASPIARVRSLLAYAPA